MRGFLRFLPACVLLLSALPAAAQREISREEYIATYAPLAMQQQKEYGIPASIKIAQGLLESRNGNSDLSRRSNNHFGIKCKSYWKGDTVLYDDDALSECFRRYGSIEESYRDHSEFLRGSERYGSLFDLDPTDYKGWAHGLKAAGYATAPHYATALIKFIEDYELYLLDDGEYPTYLASVEPVAYFDFATVALNSGPDTGESVDIDNFVVAVHSAAGHGIYFRDGRRYVTAREGETLTELARGLGLPVRRLRRFNNLDKGASLATGDVVYIEKAKKS